jgi:DNA (cytosine-5)-methyltransferase 1
VGTQLFNPYQESFEEEIGGGLLRFIDLFSGIGGFRLGLEKTDHFRHVWSCDNNSYANAVYSFHWQHGNHFAGDVRRVDPGDLPDFDLLCAGFPCPTFSLAGKREGFDDPRGSLFFEISRLAEAKKPTWLLLENVMGLLSNNRGETFLTILQELGRIGYWVEWQTLNSRYFGVPQNRERVFIVGHLRGSGTREIFPIATENRVSDGQDNGEAEEGSPNPDLQALAIETAFGNSNMRGGRISPICHALDGGASKAVMEFSNAVDCDGYLRYGHRPRDSEGKPMLVPICYRRIWKFTPIECERLQGFPDDWTKHGVENEELSDSQRYRLLGNAVTVPVIEYLGGKIFDKNNGSI